MVRITEKRETKRYYVRPQNIFCANKADVLRALTQVADSGENCTIYSLKNLADHDDVHQLTNRDIIYYYDDNVLYDKNHVLVLDYDLFIKHEEERKKINKDPVAFTNQDYAQNYDDRITKVSRDDEIKESLGQNTIPFDTFKLAIERGEEVDLGTSIEDADVMLVGESPYAYTEYIVGKDDTKYYMDKVYISEGGVEEEADITYYTSFDKLVAAIREISFENLSIVLPEAELTDYTNQDFTDHEFEESLRLMEADENKKVCCICGEEFIGYGNNALPYRKGTCCDACNVKFVIPARLEQIDSQNQED